MVLIVFASQIATAIGHNRHKKCNEALEAMWERLDRESYYKALARHGMMTEQHAVMQLALSKPEIKELLDQSNRKMESSSQVSGAYGELSKDLERLDLPRDELKLLESQIKKNLFTNYGTEYEQHALDYIRTTLSIDAVTDHTFYKKCLGEVNGQEVWVGGRIDAITPDRSLVLEVKNRIRKLFYNIPFYEHIQVQTYLELLDVDNGAVVEVLRGPGISATGVCVNLVPIKRDRTLWNNSLAPKIKSFVKVLLDVMQSAELQDEYFMSKRKQAWVMARMKF